MIGTERGNMKRQLDLSRSEKENLINEWIPSARDRDILKRRLVDGIAFESLGEEFHLSTQRIKVIVYQGIDKLSLHL
jgi:DNA-directed RNA polymerase sigma subunit (sigma70/sigma32)